MATKKPPLVEMRDKFKDKESLVDRLLGLVELGATSKDDMKSRLLATSNKKLLRLFEVASQIKSQHGGAAGLAEATAKVLGRVKDSAYVEKLTTLAKKTPARVLDVLRTAEKRAKAKAKGPGPTQKTKAA